MTTRNLDALFEPKSIALIGASNAPGSVGEVLARNLTGAGFDGPVMPVNPHEAAIGSTLAYPSVAALPQSPDLAVIATPAAVTPTLIAELGERGCRAAVVISAGFAGDGGRLRQALLDAARPHLLRIVGPNCLGFISPRRGINASFAHLTPAAGGLALVSQSGAIAAAALDWASARGVGFSHVVTIGDAADVDFGDLLDYLALDAETRGVLLYVESIAQARKFMTAGRICARAKPVVLIKAGRSAAGAKAAFSHTGALAGADEVYDAAFRRAGMLRVTELRELFDAVATLNAGLTVSGDRLAILTNGGGAGVMAADALAARGGRLAELSAETLAAIDRIAPPAWSRGNPVDIIGDATPERYRGALEALLEDPGADAILVMNCPVAVADSSQAAQAVIETIAKAKHKRPVLTCWLGETAVADGRRRLALAGAPTHETPEEATQAFMHLVEHHANQQLLLAAPPAGAERPPDRQAARRIIEAALADGRATLTDPEARDLLAAYGVPIVESRTAATPEAAGQAAEALGGEVALKILSRDLSHKTDVGGVTLGLTGASATRAAAEEMQARVRAQAPQARLDGFIVQPMVRRSRAEELICGLAQDPTFGPVVLFGAGGVAAEVQADRAVGLPPLDLALARDMIRRTRVARLLAGYRDRPPVDAAAIVEALVALSRLALDHPEVAELDINPLLADAEGVLALDARVGLIAAAEAQPPAIRPYPDALAHGARLAGAELTIRPIRPQDAPALVEMIDKSAPEDVRLRFRAGVRRLPVSWARRLSQIDYDREMALVAEAPDGAILGVGRLAGDPEGEIAEFALMVRSDWQGHGLGGLLLEETVAYAKSRGFKGLWGDVARENRRMLELADALGFSRRPGEGPDSLHVVLALDAQA